MMCMKHLLTLQQAFDSMTEFLTLYWEETGSEDLANLLSDMNTNIWTDGSTADPAIWGDWENAVLQVLQASERKMNIDEGFEAMKKFLEKWYGFTKSDDIAFILSGMGMDPAFREDWEKGVQEVLQKNKKDC